MSDRDAYGQIRRRQEGLGGVLGRRRPPESPSASMLGTVFDGGHMPAAVPGVYAVHPAKVACSEAEGAAVAASAKAGSVAFVVIGPGVPVAGDTLRAHLVGGRWVAERGRAAAAVCRGFNFHAILCNLPLAGVVITGTLFDAGGHATGTTAGPVTTDASGNATLGLPVSSGFWRWSAVAPAGSNANTSPLNGNFAFFSCSDSAITIATLVFTPAAGFVCANAGCTTATNASCGDTGTPPYPIRILPTTAFFDDGLGAVTLTGAHGGPYTGCAMRLSSRAWVWNGVGDASDVTKWVVQDNVMVPVFFSAGCVDAPNGTWGLSASFAARPGRSTTSAPTGDDLYPAGYSNDCATNFGPLITNYDSGTTPRNVDIYAAGVTGTNSLCAPSFAASGTVSLATTVVGGTTTTYVGSQVYGGSATFSVSN